MLESHRAQLLTGLGLSIVGVVISWAVYKTLFSKDKTKSQNNTATSSEQEKELVEESQISPPLAFSTRANLQADDEGEADRSHEIIAGGEESFVDEDSNVAFDQSSAEIVEELISATQSNTVTAAAPIVDLDETVTFNSSDLSNGSSNCDSLPNDSDIIEINQLNNSDIAELLAEQTIDSSVPADDSDIIEIPIVPATSKSVESSITSSVARVEESEPPTHEFKAEQDVASATPSKSVQDVIATLGELEKSLGAPNEQTNEEEPSTVNGVSEAGQTLDNSNHSDDSLNGCTSIATDSGVGISGASAAPQAASIQESVTQDPVKDSAVNTDPVPVVEEVMAASAVQTQSSAVPNGEASPTSPSGAASSDSDVTDSHSPSSQNGNGTSLPIKRVVHKFLIPEKLCGLFIGKGGRNVSALKHQTSTNIKIGREPVLSNFRYCTVEGNEKNVERALRLIKKQYPNVDTTSADLITMPTSLTLSSDRMQLHLPMGVLVEVIISHIENAGHVFVQQPTHPAFNSWQRLDDCMNKCYGDGVAAPLLPDNVEDSTLCVAPMNGRWNRTQIMSFNEDRTLAEIKLMDVGGYASVETHLLRQIREDFLSLPFQAVECYLANIEPIDGVAYSAEADAALKNMTFGQVVQCQPAAVAENNVPYIHIIAQRHTEAIVVNRELAKQGLVKWYDL